MNNDQHQNPHDKPARDNLARDIHRILRAQPDRAAPATLESRVFAEIARRAALPWYRQSFARWPLAARAVFLVVSAAIAAAMILALARILNILPARVGALSTNSLIMMARGYWNMAAGYCAYHLAGIPSSVWAIVAAGVAACYATLFGFGAAAYRYLWKAQ
jgi:hypothetical protein